MDCDTALFYLEGLVMDYAIAVTKQDAVKAVSIRRGMVKLIELSKLNVNLDSMLTDAIIELTAKLQRTRE